MFFVLTILLPIFYIRVSRRSQSRQDSPQCCSFYSIPPFSSAKCILLLSLRFLFFFGQIIFGRPLILFLSIPWYNMPHSVHGPHLSAEHARTILLHYMFNFEPYCMPVIEPFNQLLILPESCIFTTQNSENVFNYC